MHAFSTTGCAPYKVYHKAMGFTIVCRRIFVYLFMMTPYGTIRPAFWAERGSRQSRQGISTCFVLDLLLYWIKHPFDTRCARADSVPEGSMFYESAVDPLRPGNRTQHPTVRAVAAQSARRLPFPVDSNRPPSTPTRSRRCRNVCMTSTMRRPEGPRLRLRSALAYGRRGAASIRRGLCLRRKSGADP